MTVSALSAPRPVRRGLPARRWLIVLLAFEGVAALCAAVALALSAPTAGELLGTSLGESAAVATLLVAGLSGVLAVSAFSATGGLLRDRPHAELTAGGIQATILVGGAIAIATAGLLPPLVVATGLGCAGLLLALLAAGGGRR